MVVTANIFQQVFIEIIILVVLVDTFEQCILKSYSQASPTNTIKKS